MTPATNEPPLNFLDFSLSRPPKPGVPSAVLIEAHRLGDGGLRLNFEHAPQATHYRLGTLGRVTSLSPHD